MHGMRECRNAVSKTMQIDDRGDQGFRTAKGMFDKPRIQLKKNNLRMALPQHIVEH